MTRRDFVTAISTFLVGSAAAGGLKSCGIKVNGETAVTITESLPTIDWSVFNEISIRWNSKDKQTVGIFVNGIDYTQSTGVRKVVAQHIFMDEAKILFGKHPFSCLRYLIPEELSESGRVEFKLLSFHNDENGTSYWNLNDSTILGENDTIIANLGNTSGNVRFH